MNRNFVNGVGAVLYENGLVTVTFHDTRPTNEQLIEHHPVAKIIVHPDALEGVCNYLLKQLDEIKNKSNLQSEKKKPQEKEQREKLGIKLSTSSDEHL